MADFILQEIGGSITGTPANDNMTFGIQLVEGVPFIATGSLAGAEGDDSFFTLDPRAFLNGIQTAFGNQGRDTIGLANLFTAYGGQDDDNIFAPLGDPASQQMIGGQGNDTISATSGNDYIEGNQGFDILDAGAQNDLVWGGQDNDTIVGGAGLDTLYGNLGGDVLDGFAGLEAGVGADSMHGGQGNDIVAGNLLGAVDAIAGTADDTIIGGAGRDTLTGGINNVGTVNVTTNSQYDDLFRYQDGSGANVGINNIDVITDFQSAVLLAGTPNLRPDKVSLAAGDGAVLAGLNFTAGTGYDLNRAIVAGAEGDVPAPHAPVATGATVPVGISGNLAINIDPFAPVGGIFRTYEEVYAAIQQIFTAVAGTPVASTDDELQVYNFFSALGNIDPGLGGGVNGFLYINNGDTNVSSVTDMLIQGVNVVDGAGGPPVNDIVFG